MLKVSFLEFMIRGIPENILFILAANVFTSNKIKLKSFLIAIIMQSIIIYFMRFLPIHNGVDSILNLIVFMSILIIINKFEVIQAIKVSIIIMLCEFICEGINVIFLQYLLKKDLNSIFTDPVSKILYSSPSIILFGIIIGLYYIIKKKRDEFISDGEVN